MPEPQPPQRDPQGLMEDLRRALARPALQVFTATEPHPDQLDVDARKSALAVALALGRCRLFGIEPDPLLDGTLPAPMGMAAALHLTEWLTKWIPQAEKLGEAWDQAQQPEEGEDLCCDLLEQRMIAWAVFVAVEESYLGCLEDHSPLLASFTPIFDALLDGLEQFDLALHGQASLLSLVAGTFFLENWRTNLAPTYREILPWWLDGRLEELAEKLHEEALAIQPALQPQKTTRPTENPNWSWLPAKEMAAAKVPTALDLIHFDWQSEDGGYSATLAYDPCSSEPVRVNLYHVGEPALNLTGKTLVIAGIPAVIDQQGNAEFPLAFLRQAQQENRPFALQGPDDIRWQFIEPQA